MPDLLLGDVVQHSNNVKKDVAFVYTIIANIVQNVG